MNEKKNNRKVPTKWKNLVPIFNEIKRDFPRKSCLDIFFSYSEPPWAIPTDSILCAQIFPL